MSDDIVVPLRKVENTKISVHLVTSTLEDRNHLGNIVGSRNPFIHRN